MPLAQTPVRGRLAPSPTGYLHLGNAFAFLCAWLFAKSQGGGIILRMEDIDPERSKAHFADSALRDLHWLGLDWDEGPDRPGPHAPYTQSLRLDHCQRLLDLLQDKGLVYPCYCTRKELRSLAGAPHVGDEGPPYPGTCRNLTPKQRRDKENQGRKACLRLDVQKALPSDPARQSLSFEDAVLGSFTCRPADCADFALKRSDGVFAYQLAVSADDAAMGVTQVVRGRDLASSTPRQILLLRLQGAPLPSYAHIPLLCDPAGQRLAKRHASLALHFLRGKHIPPDAVTGFLAFLAGWLDRPEPARPKDLLSRFSLAGLRKPALILPDPLPDPDGSKAMASLFAGIRI